MPDCTCAHLRVLCFRVFNAHHSPSLHPRPCALHDATASPPPHPCALQNATADVDDELAGLGLQVVGVVGLAAAGCISGRHVVTRLACICCTWGTGFGALISLRCILFIAVCACVCVWRSCLHACMCAHMFVRLCDVSYVWWVFCGGVCGGGSNQHSPCAHLPLLPHSCPPPTHPCTLTPPTHTLPLCPLAPSSPHMPPHTPHPAPGP